MSCTEAKLFIVLLQYSFYIARGQRESKEITLNQNPKIEWNVSAKMGICCDRVIMDANFTGFSTETNISGIYRASPNETTVQGKSSFSL